MASNHERSITISPENVHPLTPDDANALDLRKDMLLNGYPRMNEALRQLITLSTFLLGGGAYLNLDWLWLPARVLGCLFFLAAIIAAFVGTVPLSHSVAPDRIDQIWASYERAIAFKDRWLKIAFVLMALGLLSVSLGLIHP